MPPLTLFTYIFSRAVVNVAVLYGALAAIVAIVDFIESLRFVGKFESADFGVAVQLTGLRMLGLTQVMTPFVFLFGAIWTFAQLNRRSEISVMRSAGLSIWRLIGPVALFAALIGLLLMSVVDPLASRMTGYAEQVMNSARGQRASLVRVFGDGIWLRQREAGVTLLINAKNIDESGAQLSRVTVWRLGRELNFLERIDAPSAAFAGRRLELMDARMQTPGQKLPRRTPIYTLPANVTIDDFREGAPAPETMSIWRLPNFIVVAETAGLPTVRYSLRFHDLCSTPLKLVAMVLIAAAFSMRPVRAGGAFRLLLAAIAAGFLLYVLTEIAAALGESGAVPPALAAWIPALAATTAAAARLLHLEDG